MFRWIAPEPVAAASLGQVYRGELYDGRAVAIKVPLPDDEQNQLARNLSQLGSLLGAQGKTAQAVSCLEEARNRYAQVSSVDRVEVARCLEELAALYRSEGRERDADTVEGQREALQIGSS